MAQHRILCWINKEVYGKIKTNRNSPWYHRAVIDANTDSDNKRYLITI